MRAEPLDERAAAVHERVVDGREPLRHLVGQPLRMLADPLDELFAFLQQSGLEGLEAIADVARNSIAALRQRRRHMPALREHRLLERGDAVGQDFIDALALRRDGEHGFARRRREALVQDARMIGERRRGVGDALRKVGAQFFALRLEFLARALLCLLQRASDIRRRGVERREPAGQQSIDAIGLFDDPRRDLFAVPSHRILEGGQAFGQHGSDAVGLVRDARGDFVAVAHDGSFECREPLRHERAELIAVLDETHRRLLAVARDPLLEGRDPVGYGRTQPIALLDETHRRLVAVPHDLLLESGESPETAAVTRSPCSARRSTSVSPCCATRSSKAARPS